MLERLNRVHPTIKFTHEKSHTEAVFLDVHTYKGERFRREGVLDVKTHFKTTNRFQYLHYSYLRVLFGFKTEPYMCFQLVLN